jgi:hypothetical protein
MINVDLGLIAFLAMVSGIAVGSDGLVYVTDSGNNRIQIFDKIGNYISGGE